LSGDFVTAQSAISTIRQSLSINVTDCVTRGIYAGGRSGLLQLSFAARITVFRISRTITVVAGTVAAQDKDLAVRSHRLTAAGKNGDARQKRR
jgi:hypothetical protein